MIVKSVKINNFRCHNEYKLDCEDLTTLILGENGCGKTSVLEAIYIALRGKSFRAVDRDILKRGEEFYRIELLSDKLDKKVVTYDGVSKNFLLTEKKYKRLPAKYKYPVILFEPVDLNLVAASPGRRRDYFDRLIGQLDVRYGNSLSRYEKALKQRNEILKQEMINPDTLFPWDMILAQTGTNIARGRTKFAKLINENFTNKYRTIADNDDKVELLYKTEVNNETEYLRNLSAGLAKDRALGHTSYGVHRDDFCFMFNGVGAEGSASRGELRSMVLALKFIEADLIETIMKKKPLILLDDVFSELDETRQKCLTTNFKNHQIIITSVR